MATALIAVGSNMGDAATTVRLAIEQLERMSDQPLLISSLWRTSPVDCPPGSLPYVNAAVAVTPHPTDTPESLLAKLQGLEKEFGRQPKRVHNEPRPLDLDLIAFDGEVRNTPELLLPHPRAHLRKFVLQPLSEVAPDFVLPGQQHTIAELLSRLHSPEQLIRLSDNR